MKRTLARQSFDGGDRRTIFHDSQREARDDAAAVDKHCAGAALTLVTTFLRTSEVKMLAQRKKLQSYLDELRKTAQIQKTG